MNLTVVSSSAWKNSINAAIGAVGMLICPLVRKSLNSIEKIQPRMIVVTFNGNTQPNNYLLLHKLKIQRKLNNLHNGSILLLNNDDKFLNLSNHELIQPQKNFLNFVSTCHFLTDSAMYKNKLKLKSYIKTY